MGKAGQRLIAASVQGLGQAHIEAGGKHAFIAPHRPFTQLFQRRRTDFTLWRIDDAHESAVIIGISQHAQIGQQVFNFRAGKERRAAGNFVRDAVLHQHLFKNPRLMVAAIQDRVVLIGGFINKVMRDQFTGNALRLMVFVIGREHLQLYAIAQFGKQTLLENVWVIGNQDVSRLQDAPGRTVVLLQLDHLQRREILA